MGGIDRIGDGGGGEAIAHAHGVRAGVEGLPKVIGGLAACHKDQALAGDVARLSAGGAGDAGIIGALGRQHVLRHQCDAQRHQAVLDEALLIGVDRPARDLRIGGDERHRMAAAGQFFGQRAAHEIMFIVIDHHRAGGRGAGKDIIRRQGLGKAEGFHPHHADPVAPPARAGGEHKMIGVQIGDITRRHPAFAEDLHIGQFGQHGHAPVAHPAPCSEPRQGGFMGDPAPKMAVGLGQRHLKAPAGQGQCGLKPCRPGTDDQGGVALGVGGYAFGMPAAPPFFAHRRVLGAAQRDGLVVRRPADVAADAFADFIRPAFADFQGQEGVGDGGAGGADEVLHAFFDLLDHPVGRGEATYRNHGL